MNFNSRRLKALVVFVGLLLFQPILSAQGNSRLTINNGKMTITEVFQEIEKQSNMPIAYNASKLNKKQAITLNVENATLEEVLTKTLAGTDFSYKIENDYIMIVDKTQQEAILKKVSGAVVGEDNDPLIGVNVTIKGEGKGTITNIDGRFNIEAKKGDILTVSYIGYKSVEIRVTDKNDYTVQLIPDNQLLNEVVVTALGIKRESKALSYNVQEVKSSEYLTNKDANFINALSGKVAGVTINSSSSGVGGASKVVMRGVKSISQSSNALYVIDGMPMYNMSKSGGTEFDSAGSSEAIADINPEDIESMSVLTGAAAAALYGSEAANGAIVITTKKGAAGHTNFTFTQTTDFMRPFVLPEFQNRYGTGSSGGAIDQSWGNRLTPYNNYNFKPKDDFYKTGVVATEALSFSTGTEKNQTYLSTSAVNSVGVVPNNDYDRYNFTFRNTTSALNDKLKLDVGATYIKQKDMNMINQGVYGNPLITTYLFPRGEDWSDVKMYERYDPARKINTQHWPYGIGEFTGQNPYWIANRNLRENKKDRYMLNASVSYEVLDWLSVSGRVRVDNSVNDYTEKYYATTNLTLAEGSENGLYGIATTKNKQTYADLLVNINKTFDNHISIHANIGTSYSDQRESFLKNRGPIRADGLANVFTVLQLDNNKTKRIDGGWQEQVQSIFASAEVGYKGAYYLTVTGRNDWPSQLAGRNSKSSSFFYPSVGASLVLSEIFELPEEISYLKLRTSYASVGSPFRRYLANFTHSWDFDHNIWDLASDYADTYNLKPERTDSWEVGLTARFLKYFNLDVSYYHTVTKNQTFDPQISTSSGYKSFIIQTGSVQNQGVELALGFNNTWGDFSWSSNYTLSANRNKIKELVKNYRTTAGEIINKDRLDIGGLAKARFILKPGGTLGDLYSISDLARDDNGDIKINEDGEVTVQKSEDIKLGSVLPKANMAWRNNFKYKNISLGFMVSARLGGIVYSATQAAMDNYGVSKRTADARDNGAIFLNDGDMVNPEQWYTAIGSQSGMPQYYTYSATNVRLQEASLGYTFPKKTLWDIAELTVSLVGKNLWMIYNKAPFDPESVATTGNYYQGVDYFMMPNTRNIGFNVRLKF